jgi:large conductance mechanosensitive channel
MSVFSEFKVFLNRGNVVDLAVGVVIGGAFGKIVSSLVADVLMPPVGLLLGGVNFKSLVWTLKAAVGDAPAVTMNVGLFVQTLIDFFIIAFVIFLIVKGINKTQKQQTEAPAAPTEPTEEVLLLREIRDALKK